MDPENDGEEMHCQLWWLSNPTSRFEKIHLQLVGAHLLAGFYGISSISMDGCLKLMVHNKTPLLC